MNDRWCQARVKPRIKRLRSGIWVCFTYADLSYAWKRVEGIGNSPAEAYGYWAQNVRTA